MRFSIFLITAIIIFTVGCANNTSAEIEPPLNGEVVRDQALVSQINSSPGTVTIDDVEYTMESYAWRDFAPSFNPPAGLLANNTLVRVDEDDCDHDS